jgi:hypothetical protein
MKKLIIASLIAASSAAMADSPVSDWSTTTVVNGITLVYQIDPATAQQVGTGNDVFWTAKVSASADGEIIGVANVVVDGCDNTPPSGTTALVDDNGRVLQGTAAVDWSSSGTKVYDILAKYTCIAAMIDKPVDKPADKPDAKGQKSSYTHEI